MRFDEIPHFHVDVHSPRIEHGLSVMIHVLRAIYHALPKEILTVPDLDPIYAALADATAQSVDVANSAITLLNGLHQKLDAALANAAQDPHAALAAVKAAVDALGASRQALADAITTDAPVDPAPLPEPAPVEPPAGTPLTQDELEANAGGSITDPPSTDPAL